jgi:hypothetical protein
MAVPSIERPTIKKWLLVVCRCMCRYNSTRHEVSEVSILVVSAATCGERLPATSQKASRSLLHPSFLRQVDGPCNCHLSKSLPDHCILVKGRRCRSEVSCPARKNRNRDANLTKNVFRNALLRTTYSSTADEWQSKMLCAGSTAIPNIAGIP